MIRNTFRPIYEKRKKSNQFSSRYSNAIDRKLPRDYPNINSDNSREFWKEFCSKYR